MAAHYLGPESPQPFSVLSEQFTRSRLQLPSLAQPDLYSFGSEYEKKLCQLLSEYLELDVDDKLCYVGHPHGDIVQLLQERFCLLKPISTVLPGHIHCEETDAQTLVPVRLANVGAEQYFQDLSLDGPHFDKILFKDAIPYLNDPKETYRGALATLRHGGKLLIVHRAAALCTLPLFRDARMRLDATDESYLDIIRDLGTMRCHVTWQVETVQACMSKMKWYAMLQGKFPPQMELVSSLEVTMGIRELSEGVLKYSGRTLQFDDRLVFICATKVGSTPPRNPPPRNTQAFSSSQDAGFITSKNLSTIPKPQPAESGSATMRYGMDIPDELRPYMQKR